MSTLGKLMSFFPLLVLGLCIAELGWLIRSNSALALFAIILTLYLFPPLAFRLHRLFFTQPKKISHISAPHYSPWWGGHQIQLIYLAFPFLEALLRVVPGIYSFWLRLWGSQIGKNVHWVPTVIIADRDLLKIGDDVVLGHGVEIFGHVIAAKEKRMILFTAPVCIGNGAFIGAKSHLGPGAKVEAHARLPVQTDIYPNQEIKADA